MLDVPRLATLRTVLEYGSLSAAAAALHLTQPAVSRQISLLEREVGTELVRRGARGVAPTDAGRLLAGHADAVLARLALAKQELTDLAAGTRGIVRLGSFFSALVQLSAEIAARLADTAPDIVIVDDLVDAETGLTKLRRGDLDLVLIADLDMLPATSASDLELRPLFDDPTRVVLAADHRLAGRSQIALEDLANDTWIIPHDGSAAARIEHVLAAAGLNPPRLLAGHGDEPIETHALVAAGRGITLCYDLHVTLAHLDLAVRPIRGRAAVRHLHAATNRGRRPPAVQTTLDAALHVGAQHRHRLGPTSQ
jgi:DNA-binding transcriptional LysR family regulator